MLSQRLFPNSLKKLSSLSAAQSSPGEISSIATPRTLLVSQGLSPYSKRSLAVFRNVLRQNSNNHPTASQEPSLP